MKLDSEQTRAVRDLLLAQMNDTMLPMTARALRPAVLAGGYRLEQHEIVRILDSLVILKYAERFSARIARGMKQWQITAKGIHYLEEEGLD